jgi:hypothetical protein
MVAVAIDFDQLPQIWRSFPARNHSTGSQGPVRDATGDQEPGTRWVVPARNFSENS